MRFHIPSALAGLLATLALALLISARPQEAQNAPNQEALLLKTLEALASAQTRQAVAWETLAAKGWPTPQTMSLAGALPNILRLDLSGHLYVSQNGNWSITRF